MPQCRCRCWPITQTSSSITIAKGSGLVKWRCIERQILASFVAGERAMGEGVRDSCRVHRQPQPQRADEPVSFDPAELGMLALRRREHAELPGERMVAVARTHDRRARGINEVALPVRLLDGGERLELLVETEVG